MIVALYGVALAMILCGAAALYQGYEIVMVERGWTLVISGTIAIGSGAVLAGIAHLATRLARIQTELGKMRDRLGRLEPSPPKPLPPSPLGPLRTMRESLPPIPPDARETPGAGFAGHPSAAEGALRADRPPAAAEASALESAPEPALAETPDSEDEPSQPPASKPEPKGPGEAWPDKPSVIGTYDSGGNRYVMFSDGSIEAETPNGLFRFKSLEELKEFIASGGEGQTATA